MTITIADGRGALWQWDTGRRCKITDGDGVKQVHYQNKCFGGSVDVDVDTDGTAIIPDELLQDWHTLTAYAYVTDDTGAYTMVQRDFAVHKRAKPAGYVYTPTDQMTLQTIQRQIGDLGDLQTTAKDNLVAAINEVALAGGAGSMNLRVADGYIQYSTDSGSTWTNLIAVADLKGDTGAAGTPGKDGAKGDPGAPGKDGHSPVVTTTKSGKTTTISVDGAAIVTIEDGADGAPGKDGADGLNGKDGADGKPGAAGADGAKGADGITPTIGTNGNWYIGSTDTGKPSRGATGAQGTPGKDGAKGDPGVPGKDGHSPVVTATKSGKTTTISVDGVAIATVEDGADGADGKDGAPGKDGSDATVTAASITGALGYKPAAPSDIPVVPTAEISANTADRHSHANKGVLDGITGQVTADKVYNPDHVTDLVQYAAFQIASQQIISQIPTVLPSPNALTVTCGSNSVTYDGSADKIIDIPSVEKIVTETTQVLPAYTNLIPISTDASGAVLNGVGYEAGALHSDGSVASASSFTSGFIPIKKGDVVRIKDPSAASFSLDNAVALYKADKAVSAGIGKYIRGMQSSAAYGGLTIDGDVLTWDTSSINYYAWQDFKYLRVTTSSADSIVTINEEIKESTQTVMLLKPTVKVGKGSLDFAVNEPLLAGRKIVVFGDSLIGMTRDQTSVTSYAAEYTGAKVYNVGFGGCRMAKHPTNGYAAFSMWALADAVSTGNYSTQEAQAPSGADYFSSQLDVLKSIDFTTVNAIVIHYGTNDFAASVPLDDSANLLSTDTVCGALRYSIKKILTAFPKIKIFVSPPLYRTWNGVGAETYKNTLEKTLPEYDSAMKTVAEEHNLPTIDGYKRLGINAINSGAYLSDGTHLNDFGRRQFGELIGGCLICGA